MADPSVPPLTPTSAHGEREGRTLTVSSDASSSTMSTVPRSRSATPARRAISEVIAEPLPSFDYAQIQDEFIEDDKDYDVALREMQDAVLDLIIEIQEWAVARPDLEGTKMAVSLEQEVKILMETEHDQERMRQRLLDFVGHMRQALAILATTHV